MPRPRFAALDERKRVAILEAAAEEFAHRSFEAASTNRIIARAGVSKGALYYYFDDKADLFATVIESAIGRAERAIGGMASFADAAGFWDALLDLYRRITTFFAGEPNLAGLLKSAFDDAGVGEIVGLHTARLLAAFRDLLGRGVAVGAVRDDLPLELLARVAFAVGDATDRWLLERWDSLEPGEFEAYPERALLLHMRVLAPIELAEKWERQETAS
ncbi:MAG: helix-turn-helix domain containing protein [Proteobacteria bacterium]|nr:helix-turn-helix domain containing protein [Pseudomonadota bacterium]